MSLEDRAYQAEAIERVREILRKRPTARILCVLSAGGGKTIVAAKFIESAVKKGRKPLFVAHRRELISQPFDRFIRAGLDPEQIGIILAGVELPSRRKRPTKPIDDMTASEIWEAHARRRPAAPIQIGSIDTIAARKLVPESDLVFVDEAHHAVAKKYVDLLALYRDVPVVGLTATPMRADGRGMNEVFDELVVIREPHQLREAGYLCDATAFSTREVADLSGLKVGRSGDYSAEEIEEVMDKPELVGDIVRHWLQRANGVSTIVFAASIEHSRHIVEQFKAAGVKAEHLDGTTALGERWDILKRLATGETTVVSNMGVLTEGFDSPRVKCVVLARPTASESLYIQMVFRGLRPFEGQRAIILDHGSNIVTSSGALKHGLPFQERQYSLEPRKKKRKTKEEEALAELGIEEAEEKVRTCPNCMAMYDVKLLACPECFTPAPARKGRHLEQRDGELVVVTEESVRAKAWESIVKMFLRKNEKRRVPLHPNWCKHALRERFGMTWRHDMELPKLTPEQERTRERFREIEADASGKGYKPNYGFARLEAERRERILKNPGGPEEEFSW